MWPEISIFWRKSKILPKVEASAHIFVVVFSVYIFSFLFFFKHCQLDGFKIQQGIFFFLFKRDRFSLKRSELKAEIPPCCARSAID